MYKYYQGYTTDLEDLGIGRGGSIGHSRRDQSYGSNPGSSSRRDDSKEKWEDYESRQGRNERKDEGHRSSREDRRGERRGDRRENYGNTRAQGFSYGRGSYDNSRQGSGS